MRKVFISYAYESPEYVDWVASLAERISVAGFEVRLDRAEDSPESSWGEFMHRGLADVDAVLVLCSPEYRRKFESGDSSGVSVEASILLRTLHLRKQTIVPAISLGEPHEVVPSVLDGWEYIDLQDFNKFESNLDRILRRLSGVPTVQLTKPASEFVPSVKQVSAVTGPYQSKSEFPIETLNQGFLAEFREYFVRKDGSEKPLVPLTLVDSSGRSSESTNEDFRGERVAVVVGEFGSGKSVLAYSKLSESPATSLLTRCRSTAVKDKSETFAVWAERCAFSEAKRLGINGALSEKSISNFLSNKESVVIVDGVDELCFSSGDSAARWLSESMNLLPCRFIVTTRPVSLNGMLTVVPSSRLHPKPFASVTGWSAVVESYAVFRIDPLTDDKVALIAGPEMTDRVEMLLGSDFLGSAARRPVLLDLLLGEDDIEDSLAGITDLFSGIIDRWVETHRVTSEVAFKKIQSFLEDLAVHMWLAGTRHVSTEFAQRLLAERDVEIIVEIEQCSFLTYGADRTISFSHNLFLEYLVARRILEDLVRFRNAILYSAPLPELASAILVVMLEARLLVEPVPDKAAERMSRIEWVDIPAVQPFRVSKYCVSRREYQEFLVRRPLMVTPNHEPGAVLNWIKNLPDPDWVVADIEGYLESTRHTFPAWESESHLDLPVVFVSYFDARMFAFDLGSRIPTFSEWLSASTNVGVKPTAFPWGNEPDPSKANVLDNPMRDSSFPLANVQQFEQGATRAGVVQMVGNVAEWSDHWADELRGRRLICGGAFMLSLDESRPGTIQSSLPAIRRNFVGIRLAS
jgi:hypothetical protein